jgi:hypothetical protein
VVRKTALAEIPDPEKQLAAFIGKFAPDLAKLIEELRAVMRERIPQALELVYDNYNFFVIGYGPTEKAGDAIFSLAAQARGVSLCFLQGAGLPDPAQLLRGTGTQVRSIRLPAVAILQKSDVRKLMKVALERAKVPLTDDSKHRLIIKSVSAKQRPRRPIEKSAVSGRRPRDSTVARRGDRR